MLLKPQKSKKSRKIPPPSAQVDNDQEISAEPSQDNEEMDTTEEPPQADKEQNSAAEDIKDDGTGLAQKSDDDDDSDLDLMRLKPQKKRKKGIIYISNIPKHMNVTRIREILGEHGKIGRVYLQPEKLPGGPDRKKKKRKPFARHFTEGWVEFESKRVAKQIVELLNNKQISTRKKSQFYDYLWSMKYLPRFKWMHLTERMNYEQAVHKQRLLTEVSQARKETNFFQNNLDKSEYLKKVEKKRKAKEAKEKAKAEKLKLAETA